MLDPKCMHLLLQLRECFESCMRVLENNVMRHNVSEEAFAHDIVKPLCHV